MTARRRKAKGGLLKPSKSILQWFAGAAPMPWDALLSPTCEECPRWWREYLAANPGAVPPADALPSLTQQEVRQ